MAVDLQFSLIFGRRCPINGLTARAWQYMSSESRVTLARLSVPLLLAFVLGQESWTTKAQNDSSREGPRACAIPATYFGLHISHLSTPWPGY